ncbi:hypothetical protein H2200_003239 [Cladophialophora chaetospira]|uniref:Uncharacterized protein n=1 Tax=Cladophialophora chaetospira TaxID=386627 RepID=A0AA39CM34_9EURO|nr:hypothetical protein H2200_003239 [Cladophialophora chaetospira]
MSYPSLSNYGEYYESNQGQGQQNMNNSYNSSRQPASTNPYAAQASYPGDISQSRYSSSGYDWSNQPQQQNYSSSSRQRTYGGDGWIDGSTQNTSHDERTQASSYATQAAAGTSGHNYYGPTSTSQSTQGLSSLAYASGLEEAGSQRHGQHTQRSSAPSASGYSSAAVSHGLNRVQSPATTSSASRYNTTPSTNATYSYQNDSSSSQGQGNSLTAAAAALAGAVSARFSQASATMGGQSVSPVMASSASAQHSASQRSASPYQQAQSAKTQAQRQQTSSTPHTNYKAANAVAYQQRTQPLSSGQHARAPSQTTSQRPSQTQQQPVNSISNLVTHSLEEAAATQYSTATEPQSMPNYIDPTQVFNPYAKEHERRRREAIAQAEAEAKRKQQEEEAAAKRKAEEEAAATAAEKQRAEEAAAAKKRDQQAASAARKAKSRQNARNAVMNAQSQSATMTSPHVDQTQPAAAGGEADMAAELKAMMEKMKEFRSKDPGLFQRLWEDMRKPTSGPSTTVTIQSPSPQMSTQQTVPPVSHPPNVGTVATPQPSQQHEPIPPPQPTTATPTPARPRRQRRRKASFEVPPGAQINGYKVVVEDNEEGLPDLGRFPAERRIRQPYATKTSADVASPTESPAQAVHAQPVGPRQSPVPPNQGTPAVPSQPQAAAPAIPSVPSSEKAAPLTQGLPPRGPAGGTIWPEEKRNALAEAAVITLKAVPENADIEISPQDIHGMLEQNPSYIDLCELLEKKGLKFHRGHFARQLLSNVPYLNGPQGKPVPTPSTPVPAQQPNGTPSLPTQHIGAVAIPPGTSAGASTARFQAINGAASGPFFKSEKPVYAPQYPPGIGIQMPRPKPARPHPLARPEPPPGSKEAMARKRDFSELVDLTALSDNEDYVMSRKQARVESPSPEPVDPFQIFQQDQIMKNGQQLHAAGMYPPPGYPPGMQLNGNPGAALRFDPNRPQWPQGYAPLPHYPAQPAPPVQVPSPTPAQQQARAYKALAKPVNKQEALQKTYYDAKTVARDLLIAAGRHPTERPLNAHLAGLLGKHIDIDSDLSTFDWDAIDPGGPPVPQVPYADVPMEPPRFAFKQGVRAPRPKLPDGATPAEAQSDSARLPDSDKREGPAPAPRSRPAPAPSTNGEIAHGRPREEKPPALETQSAEVPVVSTDLGPTHLVRRGRPPRRSTPNSAGPQKRTASLVVSSNNTPASERKQSARPGSSQPQSLVASSTGSAQKMDTTHVFPSGKRRGRPPGAKNVHPSFGAMKQIAAAQLNPTEVRVNEKSASPINPVFKCRWKGCQAHLHNLETIRNHVSKVHRPTSEQLQEQSGYVCWWKKCKLLVEDEEGKLGPSKIFDLKHDWLAHIEEDHLKEIAQKFGDGPSLKHIGKQEVKRASFPFDVSQFSFVPHPALPAPQPSSPNPSLVPPFARTFSYTDPQTILQDRTRYLSSPNGQITTPDVTTPSAQEDLSPDTMRLLKADHQSYEEQAQRAFMKTHRQEKSSPKAIAEETLKAMSQRKVTIGAGIDKGGCILVNKERRATLIQNPGIQRVVEGDY